MQRHVASLETYPVIIKVQHVDFQTIVQNYLDMLLGYLNEPWMIWVYGVLILMVWVAAIMLGYHFRQNLALFMMTVTVTYLLVGVLSVMAYRVAANPQIAGQSNPDIFPDPGDETTVYHHHSKEGAVSTPAPTPVPRSTPEPTSTPTPTPETQ